INIKSYEDFILNVPIHSYEDLRLYIKDQEKYQKNFINISQPVLYAQTSGTTDTPKYIPILKNSLRQYKKSQHIVAYTEYKDISKVYDGKILAIVSPAIEGELKSKTPYGSMSGLIYQSMPRFFYNKYVVPPKIFQINDYDLKYYLISAFALAEQDITLIATANPSTILKINAVISEQWDNLVTEVELGNKYGLRPNPKRAQDLRELYSNKAKYIFADLWPNLKSVTTWMDGSCAVLIPILRKLLSQSTKIVEMGYISSEFRGSINIDVINNKCIPTIHENFFEFVERDEWENKNSNFLTIENIKKGKQYYVFVTTQNGLYRYFINDIIEVNGRFNKTPTINFVQKGKGVTNITGEKLYESQVIAAIQAFKKEIDLEFDFFVMIANQKSLGYSLYIETEQLIGSAKTFEKHLSNLNIEFKQKRNSGRLKPTSIMLLKSGTADSYKKYCIKNGQREGQFKMINLQYQQECSFNFDKYIRT
ncbi:MAG: GH3 auxin-responsive promoter family protein, partial [Pseudomonadota bacterium]